MSQAEKKVIPEGYKQMGLGLIPEDWEVVTLDDAANFLDGQRRPVKSGDRARIKGQYPYYGASGIVDYVNDYIFDGEFILLGEDGENILSRNLPLAFKASGKIWVNNHAHVMTPKANFQIDFLTSYLESLDYSLLNSGTAQPKLNKQSCLNIKVIKPLYEEQTAIANALSDVDALLSELENLIAKKQAIKTATMQQLLTGKTRLPQFAFYSDINSTEGAGEGKRNNASATIVNAGPSDGSLASQESRGMDSRRKGTKPSELGEIPEDWDVVEFGAITIYVGSGKTSTKGKGEFPLFGSTGQIGTCPNGDYIGDALLVARVGANAGTLNFVTGQYGVSDNTILLKLQKSADIDFYKYLLIRKNLNTLVFGSGQPLITGSQLKSLKVVKPKQEEQTAIATILSDMDNEIQTLEQRLSKTRQIKQGMMQELLTGKTRLPFTPVQEVES